MMDRITKSDRAELFRVRLATAMVEKSFNQSSLAREIHVDRSTVSQLLVAGGTRLPNAQVVGECATALGVSADWLLGLTARPERTADILAASMTATKAPRALIDDQIFAWHQEAAGYKIRHVPASLPDMLKTREMLVWEYTPHLGRSAEQAIGASQDRLNWMRTSRSDYEIVMPVHDLRAFAHAEGYYSGLPADIRRDQLQRLLELNDQLFPTLRLFLYDARRVWSSPITVFGPLLAVLYLGHDYLAFRDSQRVQGFTRHFDWLVREATVPDRDVPDYVAELMAAIYV
ncbi:MAG: helix-turn-helix domain-containing protein [Paracoccaceae bacterium]